MTDITANETKIQIEEAEYRRSVSKDVYRKLGGNINSLITKRSTQLGSIRTSLLTESQFRSLNGDGWVRMTGQSIVGSDLNALTGQTTLPDMVGNEAFLRSTNSSTVNGGAFEEGQNAQHNHFIANQQQSNGIDLQNFASRTRIINPSNPQNERDFNYNLRGDFPQIAEPDVGLTSTDGGDFKPKSYKVNYFILINL